MKRLLILTVVTMVAAGCATTHQATVPAAGAATAGSLPTGVSSGPVSAPGSCHVRTENNQPLPDPTCTPGATNPDATQANLSSTVCKSGWTATIRPPASYTDKLKREQISAYGYSDTKPGDYEEDHLISLELGGAPSDPRNLWPQPGASPNPKDKVENELHSAVCSDLIQLTTAQTTIATDWATALDTAGLIVTGSKVCLKATPTKCTH